ncbi:MAG TPA: hypothetical protein VMD04_02445, partial [Candidatus Margulisiibacteriota bacterium]|nr:hypothetical protein [Candidatus Margulisiibacteriota bacterium]
MPQHPLAKTFKNRLLNISLLAFSVIFAVLLVEILLHFTRYRYYIIKYPPGFDCPDRAAMYDICENHPPIREDHAEFSVVLFSNALGCFDREYFGEKDYIFLTGDSFTFGHALFEDKYGTLLEGYLGERVLKCGVGGYGSIQEYLKIKKVVGRIGLNPKLIIVGYWMGDDLRNDLDCLQKGYTLEGENSPAEERLLQGLFKPSYSLHHPRLSLLQKAKEWLVTHSLAYHFFNKNALVRAVGEKLGLIDILFANLEFAPLNEYPWLKDAWEFHLGNLKEIKKLADSYRSELLIVLLPADLQVYDFLKPKGRYDFNQPNRMLANFF